MYAFSSVIPSVEMLAAGKVLERTDLYQRVSDSEDLLFTSAYVV